MGLRKKRRPQISFYDDDLLKRVVNYQIPLHILSRKLMQYNVLKIIHDKAHTKTIKLSL